MIMVFNFNSLHLSVEKSLQILSAATWSIIFLFGEILSTILTVYLMRTSYFWLILIYIIIIINQRNSSTYGNHYWTWIRNWKLWYYLHDYFPVKLIKTIDLNPNCNYLFCAYPHGFLSTGCFMNFCTEASNFKDFFPGMKSYMATLQGHFFVPFFRHILMWLGICSSSQDALNHMLNKRNGVGKCIALVLGGSAEALNCHNKLYKIHLRNKKGFIKVAMRHGTHIVPVFSFGETDIYEQLYNPEGSFLRSFQEWFIVMFGIAPILPMGRGFFQKSFGIIPHRKNITTVVGKPIEILKNCDPTEDEIDLIHAKFVKSLQELFDDGKFKYLSYGEEAKLIID